jgi:hypothetical protein
MTMAGSGRKIAINNKMVREVVQLPPHRDDGARTTIAMQPVNYKDGSPEWIDVEEDFDVVVSRLNMAAQ